ncbi:MAG: dihydrodipicolinate synthase family protein [Oscillospiraceae bacterium]|nr:dihydrodipicolinate synthase family protein [Oscillospiraceae bacterium]
MIFCKEDLIIVDKIRGVIPPMITPFKESGDVDYSGFASNIQKWNNDRMAGYLVIGSNSETVYLNEEEKLELVKLTVENSAPGRVVMAGTGLESARETITFTNKCARLGAHCALVLTPFYYGGSMTTAAMIKYFTTVADASDIPVLLYNVSKFTHVNLSAEAVAELSRHPNIVGMKDSNGDVPQLATFLRVADPSFQVMTGTFSAWYPALALGVTGIISAMANCSPNEIAEVQELFDAGKWEEARDLYQRMFPVNGAVTGSFGIAGLKFATDYCGYTGGYVRNPLSDSSEEDKKKLAAILQKAQVADKRGK